MGCEELGRKSRDFAKFGGTEGESVDPAGSKRYDIRGTIMFLHMQGVLLKNHLLTIVASQYSNAEPNYCIEPSFYDSIIFFGVTDKQVGEGH
ncbi:MAG TPA: hypothetical protein DIU00_17110 [Phycisphaerales bacterium]|nr:hypothetical protein [Phycisphaerales bacterium]